MNLNRCINCGSRVFDDGFCGEINCNSYYSQCDKTCAPAPKEKEMKFEQMLLSDLKEGPVHFTDKRAVGRRLDLLNRLQEQGKIAMRIVEVDDQESYLEVKLT